MKCSQKSFFIAMQSGNNYLNMYRLMPNGGRLLVNYTTISWPVQMT